MTQQPHLSFSSFRRKPESGAFVFSDRVLCFSARVQRAGNFSLLAQRKVTKRKRVRASTPQEELHKGDARGCRFHVQLGRTKLKGGSLRMRSERRHNPDRTSCTWNPQSPIQKHCEYPPQGVIQRAFFRLPFFARAKKGNPLGRRPSGSLAPKLPARVEALPLKSSWIPAFAGMTSKSGGNTCAG